MISAVRLLRSAVDELGYELRATRLPFWAPITVAVSLGLTSGLMEAAYRTVHFRVTGRIPVDPWGASVGVWMAPIGNALLFAILACGLVLISRKATTLGALPVSAFLFTALGAFVLFRAPAVRLHSVAAVILSLAIAVRFAQVVMRRPRRFYRGFRRSNLLLGGFVASLCVILAAWPRWSERRVIDRLPEPASEAPNVLLIILDTVRAGSMSLYGHNRLTTPNIDRIASSGIVFERAFATSPWTLPSHATMFTSRFGRDLGVGWLTALDDTYATLAEVLGEHGYLTSAFVANLIYCRTQSGLGRGFHRYEDYPISWGAFVQTSWLFNRLDRLARSFTGNHDVPLRKPAAAINDAFLEWLPTAEARPFFAFLNYFDTHTPYRPPRPFKGRFSEGEHRYWIDGGLSADEFAGLSDLYDETLAYLDDQIGALFDELAATGVLETTWTIITSDHGEQFGEHGFAGHGNTLYSQLLHVPLIVIPPTRLRPETETGIRVSEPVTLRDLPVTVAEITGLARRHPFLGTPWDLDWRLPGSGDDPGARSGGNAPSPIIAEANGRRSSDPFIATPSPPLISLIRDGFHYIRDGDRAEELYDVFEDLKEERDLSGSPDHAARLSSLRAALDSVVSTFSRRVP